MARNYSSNARRNLNSTQANEPFLFLLEITHVDLAQPIRVVSDTVDLTVGITLYQAFPFDITLPDDTEGQVAKAQLSIDNIGREITQWLEYSRGGQGAKCRVMQVLRSNPTVIELDLTLDMTNISADLLKITATLEYVNVFNQKGVTKTYRPENQAGLF